MQQSLEMLVHQLETPESTSFSPNQPTPEAQVPKLTCIERASNLVDSVTNSLYLQILNGLQAMNRRKSIKDEEQASPSQHKSMQQKTVDIDLHKRMIRKFMRLNRKSLKSIQQRSVQFEEVARKCKEEEAMRRNQQKNKTLQVRREKISERLKSKERFKHELQRMVRDSNLRISSVKNTKFLYQEKEEAFKREFVLPRIEEEKRILTKIKERVKPMDMTEILQHQKSYEEKLINDRLNRSLTSRVIQSDNFYEPPKYVAKAFLIAEAEEDLKREEQKLKEQTLEINEFRKKEFIKIVQEKQRQELQRIKESSFQRNRSNRTYSIQGEQSKRERQKSQLSREETKNIGNQYMKQLVNLNRMHRSKPSLISQDQQPQLQQPKSQVEIELIKEERIEQVQKIRLRKIEDILNSSKLDDLFKLERLNHEKDKFQALLARQQDGLTKKSQADELASIVLSSIHTKLAILQVTSPK